MALNVKVGLIGALDMLKFKNLAKTRRSNIDKAPVIELPKTYITNEKAKSMHPLRQEVIISEMRKNGPDSVTVKLASTDGKSLAPFRAGQYINVSIAKGATKTTRSYSLSSSPALAYDGFYEITVKRVEDGGYASKIIQDEWNVGEKLFISAPQGHLYYEGIRDEKKVIALAGGVGITPFMSMARAINDGYEDFDLTIIYGSNTEKEIVFRDELDEIAVNCPKVKVVYVLAKEEKENFEKGFINADIISKYSEGKPVSVFMCGPQAMYNALEKETAKLGLDFKHVRREMFGMVKDPTVQKDCPPGFEKKVFNAKVIIFDKEYNIDVRSDESLLTAFERAGIAAPSRCRSGECGWCRSRLISGDVYVPKITDGRRGADKQFNYIHPCASFAMSDVVVEVPGQYQV